MPGLVREISKQAGKVKVRQVHAKATALFTLLLSQDYGTRLGQTQGIELALFCSVGLLLYFLKRGYCTV